MSIDLLAAHVSIIRDVVAAAVAGGHGPIVALVASTQVRLILREGDQESEKAILIGAEGGLLTLVSALAKIQPDIRVARAALAAGKLPQPFRFCIKDGWYALRADTWPEQQAPGNFGRALTRMLPLVEQANDLLQLT